MKPVEALWVLPCSDLWCTDGFIEHPVLLMFIFYSLKNNAMMVQTDQDWLSKACS